MLTAAILYCTLAPTLALDASDFFPLAPGTKWTYSEETKFKSDSYTDEVKEPVEIGLETTFPIERKHGNKVVETVYYKAAANSISIFAYDDKKPIEPPRFILKVGDGPQKWEFMPNENATYSIKATSSQKGKRKILDKEVECLEVRFEARIESPGQPPITSRQISIYGKGFGLVEMQERTAVGRNTEERKVKLVDFTPGHP